MDFILENYPLITAGFFLGLIVGALTGLFGAGGGFIITPALNIFLGLPMNLAVGTSACQVLGASSFSLFHHLDRRLMGIKVALFMGIGIPFGSLLGTFAVAKLKVLPKINILDRELNSVDFLLLLIFLFFLSIVAGWLLYDNFLLKKGKEAHDESNHKGLFTSISIPPIMQFRTIPYSEFSIPILTFLGFFIGFLSGMLGIGGGVIMLPLLFYIVGQETKYAALTSTMLVFISGFFATVFHAIDGNIDFILVIGLIAGAFAGSRIGAKIQKKISGHSIRKYFAFVVLAAAFLVLYKIIDMMFLN